MDEKDMECIRVSIRSLVEFILRSGDIDNRKGGMADAELMQLGSRLHRKIQGQMGVAYRAEVPLKYTMECRGERCEYCLEVEGRADGIMIEDDGWVIDEIKGVYKPLEFLEEPVAVHLAQAKCYAYIYAAQEKLETIGVQMSYCHLESEEVKRFRSDYTLEE